MSDYMKFLVDFSTDGSNADGLSIYEGLSNNEEGKKIASTFVPSSSSPLRNDKKKDVPIGSKEDTMDMHTLLLKKGLTKGPVNDFFIEESCCTEECKHEQRRPLEGESKWKANISSSYTDATNEKKQTVEYKEQDDLFSEEEDWERKSPSLDRDFGNLDIGEKKRDQLPVLTKEIAQEILSRLEQEDGKKKPSLISSSLPKSSQSESQEPTVLTREMAQEILSKLEREEQKADKKEFIKSSKDESEKPTMTREKAEKLLAKLGKEELEKQIATALVEPTIPSKPKMEVLTKEKLTQLLKEMEEKEGGRKSSSDDSKKKPISAPIEVLTRERAKEMLLQLKREEEQRSMMLSSKSKGNDKTDSMIVSERIVKKAIDSLDIPVTKKGREISQPIEKLTDEKARQLLLRARQREAEMKNSSGGKVSQLLLKQKLELEKQKLELEKRKLELEEQKQLNGGNNPFDEDETDEKIEDKEPMPPKYPYNMKKLISNLQEAIEAMPSKCLEEKATQYLLFYPSERKQTGYDVEFFNRHLFALHPDENFDASKSRQQLRTSTGSFITVDLNRYKFYLDEDELMPCKFFAKGPVMKSELTGRKIITFFIERSLD